jgi:hypothetical protein
VGDHGGVRLVYFAVRKGIASAFVAVFARSGCGVGHRRLVSVPLAQGGGGGRSSLRRVASAPVFLADALYFFLLKGHFAKSRGVGFVNNIKFSNIPLTISVKCSIIMATIFPWRKNK